MSRFLKLTFLVLGIAAGGAIVASAFSLLGKFDSWQETRIGYALPGDIGGPMNIGEEYRWNLPLVTYAFDESFINYFGTNGVAAVEKAMQVLNDLPPASQITDEMIAADTSIFPPYVIAENAQAGALRIADMKTATLHAMLEQLGLAEPERYVYTLRSRTTFSDPDFTNWVVIQRNFDPVTFQPTNRINDTFYIWNGIVEAKNPDHDYPRIVQLTPEPNAGTVAGGNIMGSAGLYYPGTNAATALTRDDVGGLRYLLRPSNLNVERLPVNAEEIFTNMLSPVFLTNYSLALLIQETTATTNSVERVLELFPGLQITGTNTYLTNIISTNITSFFTNFPYQLGAELEQVYVTNYIPNIVQLFDYQVGNIVTNPGTVPLLIQEIKYEIAPAENYTPGGSQFVTNILVNNIIESTTETFYIKPTNAVDLLVLSNAFTSMISTTNTVATSISELVARTNENTAIALTTQDYYEFIRNTRNTTNTLAQVLSLYPGLLVTSSNSSIGFITETNITSKIINYPWAPEQVFETQYVHTVVTNYDYTAANVVLDSGCFTTRPVTIHEFEVVPGFEYTPGTPTYQTNSIIGPYDDVEVNEDCVFGEFFIVPTNLIGYAYISNVLTTVTNTTNVDYFAISDMVIITNNHPQDLDLLETHDLGTFSEQARTNSPAELLAIYPELMILQSNRYFTNLVSSNYIAFLTNHPYDPAVIWSIGYDWYFTTNIATNYAYVFGNVVTNFGDTGSVIGQSLVLVEEEIIAPNPYDPAGSPFVTNLVSSQVLTNVPIGNIYIVPTNLFGYQIISTQLVEVVGDTNTFIFTNIVDGLEQTNTIRYIRFETNYWLDVYPISILSSNEVATNIFGRRREFITYTTNTTYEVYPIELLSTNDLATNIFGIRHETIKFFTNSILAAYPIETRPPTYNVGLRAGIDKISFVRVDYDSLTGTNRVNLTNIYVDTVIISNTPMRQTLRRVLTRPDILFSAADLGTIQGQPVFFRRTNTDSWENNDADNGDATLAGPGVIHAPVTISFSKVGPYYDFDLFGTQFLQQTSPLYRWGSFDSSTNIIVFPEGTSVQDIEQQILTP